MISRLQPTSKELEALRALIEHGTITEAARGLGLSPHTIDARLDHLRDKTGCRYLPQLVLFAGRQGWLADPTDDVANQPETNEDHFKKAG